MLYGVMFDEVSEGTAYYKIAPSKKDVPANAQLLYTTSIMDGMVYLAIGGCASVDTQRVT